jgi:Fe-S cluster assembly protein SufD
MDKLVQSHTDAKAWHLSNFDVFESKLNGSSTVPFHETRKSAISRFSELGFPTTRNEEWKYTNVAPIANQKFKLAAEAVQLNKKVLSPFTFGGVPQNLLVFVNGRFVKEWSHVETRAKGLVIGSLASVLEHDGEAVQKYLAKYANFENEPFTALNTAFTHDGAFVRVPAGTVMSEPIHLLNLSAESPSPWLTHPRNLIIIGAASQVQIVESYQALSEHVYFNNVVSEIVVEADAHVEHVRIQNESKEAYHIATREVHQSRGSKYSSISFDLGGALVRNNFNLRLNALDCEGNLWGFYMASGSQQVDNHTLIDHAMPHCQSNEHYKGILADKAHGVFNGKVMVRPDAQKTNAYQKNQCLLLSDEAVINSKPQLEIFADDVKCSHGASIGQLDDEALFYLRSRGIGEAEANSLLHHAFAGDVLNHVTIEPVRAQLDEMINAAFEKA